MYRVPNNDSPPSPEKTMHVRNKMKTPTGSPFNSTSLLKSPVASVLSNGITNNLKKEGRKKKELKSYRIFVNLELDYLTPQRVKLSYVKFITLTSPYLK